MKLIRRSDFGQWMTFERWVRTFKPIYQGDTASWGGLAIENYRDRWDEIEAACEERRLWTGTITDNDGYGFWTIDPGCHVVNRDCYFICEVPFPDDDWNVYAKY